MSRNKLSRTADAGFTLIELLIVMSIMLVLMALAVPQMHQAQQAGPRDVRGPDHAHHRPGRAQLQLRVPHQRLRLLPRGPRRRPQGWAPTAQAAQFLDPVLASTGQKSGYTFAITNCTKVTVNNQDTYTSYEVTGVPQVIGKTGDNGYCSDENNIVKFDPTGGTNCTQPIQ